MTDTQVYPRPILASSYRPVRVSRFFRMFLRMGDMLECGTLTVTLPDGSQRRFGGRAPGPEAFLTIHRERLARRFLIRGNLGFCEGYLEGDWSSPDIEALFVFFLMNQDRLSEAMAGKRWTRALGWLRHQLRANNRSGAKRNIVEHYDLGNAFYEAWLDPTMTYSSAVYAGDETDLALAQRRKYELLVTRMGLKPGHRVLEIGCGWGGFAEFAAAEVGADVTAITISPSQHEFASRRIHEAGLGDRVSVRLQDYRDVEGDFDRIASIEMFEAVGERYWPRFFASVRDRLVGGGQAALQVITIEDRHFDAYRRSADYIQRYIFPGGMLPSPTALKAELAQAGLMLKDMAGYGAHYAMTLRDWNRRFQAAWPEIQVMGFDHRFKRMWEQYLHYCAAGFRVGHIDVQQLAIARD